MATDRHRPDADTLLCVAVGNTRTRFGIHRVGPDGLRAGIDRPEAVANEEPVGDRIIERLRDHEGHPPPTLVVASVADVAWRPALAAIREAMPEARVLRVGVDLPIPIANATDEPDRVGHDRLLGALAAWSLAAQACVVVDVGTAVTVNFVDGEGTFHGGAIAPGIGLMLDALERGTERVGRVAFAATPPDAPAFGLTTEQAVRLGVASFVRGGVRHLVERYAEHYRAYPMVIATGGDAGLLESEGIVDHFVPDLQLVGIAACWHDAMRADDEP